MAYLQRQSARTSVASPQSLQASSNKAHRPHCIPIIPSHENQKQKAKLAYTKNCPNIASIQAYAKMNGVIFPIHVTPSLFPPFKVRAHKFVMSLPPRLIPRSITSPIYSTYITKFINDNIINNTTLNSKEEKQGWGGVCLLITSFLLTAMTCSSPVHLSLRGKKWEQKLARNYFFTWVRSYDLSLLLVAHVDMQDHEHLKLIMDFSLAWHPN